ncbi:evolutionarily conserved signaling intermediate in Toll pathway, mitochondrial-like [Asterias amurensis]|uniref:evolutionarily conserved signaling intermediate in Toll pathway, mitochondrial-like n=1 Tax=Asterias amurensis TaxID=7602 RepID=UPI003AB2292E
MMATIKFCSRALYNISSRGLPHCSLLTAPSLLQITNILGNTRSIAPLHTSQPRCAGDRQSEFQPSRVQKSSLVLSKNLFDEARQEDANKETFKKAVAKFTEYDKRRRGHVQFIETALRHMKDFKVEKEVDAYNAVLNTFPKGKFVPENLIQSIYNHFPEQQICAIKVLQMMEDNTVLPNNETKEILISVFGKRAHPVKKYQRMMYWFPKFRNINPFPLPKEIPNDPVKLSELGLKRIAEYEAKFKVFYLNGSSAESENPNFIANIQSPEQQELLAEHNPIRPLYVEGAFHLWLRSTKMTYFVLRGDPFAVYEDELKTEDAPQAHAEGPVFAMCMTNENSQETLHTWLQKLQEENPNLARIPVIFNLFKLSDTKDTIESLPTNDRHLLGET